MAARPHWGSLDSGGRVTICGGSSPSMKLLLLVPTGRDEQPQIRHSHQLGVFEAMIQP